MRDVFRTVSARKLMRTAAMLAVIAAPALVAACAPTPPPPAPVQASPPPPPAPVPRARG